MAGGRGIAASRAVTRRILVVAPHPDDEIVACGIAGVRARDAGDSVYVLYLTTGVPAGERLWAGQRGAHAARVRRRREEALAAAAMLGFKPVAFCEWASRELRRHLDEAAGYIARAIRQCEADALWVPAFEGAHQDHDAANALAAGFGDRVPVQEFAAYNFSGARVRANRFPSEDGAITTLVATPEESALKRRALACYASERGNLAHIGTERESWRALAQHDYGRPPHAGRLFRERFHWVPFRHPRIDFDRSREIYRELGRFAARRSG
ncbi:MAG: PIG-L family deacetylase [Alphaproteobacteria bacterium]|nr:PIG-L family deacetylase [Alphaproteobacteria bacterium]